MKKQRKHCNNCHYSYYRTEGQRGKRQHCNNPNYNSAAYSRKMLMEACPQTTAAKKSSRSRITWNDTAERSPMASSCRREMDVQSVMETVSTSCCKNNNIQWRTYRYEHSFDAG